MNLRIPVAVILGTVSFSALAAPACMREFDAFMARFETDRAFQREQTVYPLTYSVSESGTPDKPRTQVYHLSRAQARPMDELEYPSPQARAARGLLEARQCTHPTACVIAFDDRADDRKSLRFSLAQRRGCWRLVGIARVGP